MRERTVSACLFLFDTAASSRRAHSIFTTAPRNTWRTMSAIQSEAMTSLRGPSQTPTAIPTELPLYRYAIRRLGAGSSKYGPCEVCRTHASEMYYQMEERQFLYNGKHQWTSHECHSKFGHEHCLIGKRHPGHAVVPLEHMQCGPAYVS